MADMSQNLTRFLKVANSKWADESARAKNDPGFVKLDDGRYIGWLTNAELKEAQNGKPMVQLTFKIVEGDNEGAQTSKFCMLDNDDGFFYLGKTLLVFGIDIEDIHWDNRKSKEDTFIVNVLKHLVEQKLVVKIRLRTSGTNQYTDVEELVEDYELPEQIATPGFDTPEETEEEVEEEEVEDEVDLAVGMKVSFTWKGEKLEGVINALLEEEQKVKVKIGSKIYPVGIDKIEIVDAELES